MRCDSMVVLSAALLLGTASVALTALAQHTADDAQCSDSGSDSSSSSSDSSDSRANGADVGLGWRENATHATAACTMPVVHAGAGGLSLGALVQHLAAASTPLLIRGLLDLPDWREQAGALGNRTALLDREGFGGEQMQLSVGTLLSNGPESTVLDGKKLDFMREAWGAVKGSVLGEGVEQQVRAGEPRPRVGLGNWLDALREGTTPRDSYVFQNVSGGPLVQALAPLHALWRDAAFAQFALQRGSLWQGADPPALTRLGVGGSGSGAPFHDHDVIALNVAFAGRKRWLVTRPCRPTCRIPFYEGGAAVYHPAKLLSQPGLPTTALRMLADANVLAREVHTAGGGDTWDCTQHPGEVVFIPAMFLHATINLDESVAVAVQCDDGVDPRAGLSHLNALIVHANGVCILSVNHTRLVSLLPFFKMAPHLMI